MQLIMEPEFKPRQPDSRVPMLMFLRSSIPAKREATQSILEIDLQEEIGPTELFSINGADTTGHTHAKKEKKHIKNTSAHTKREASLR